MPNGGVDNCHNCGFNRRNRGEWRCQNKDESVENYCTIRKVAIPNPAWTYCANFRSHAVEPEGFIYTAGMYEERYENRRLP